MRLQIIEHAVVNHYLSNFGKLVVNQNIEQISINPSLILFWPFVNRFLTLSESFVIRDLGVLPCMQHQVVIPHLTLLSP